MGKTAIAWCDYSLNFIKWFCSRISPGCKNCYMYEMSGRFPANAADHPIWREGAVNELRKIPAGAFVFIGDMYDQYHEEIPDDWIQRVHNFAHERSDLYFLLLTKRIKRVVQLAPRLIWPKNLWLGVTVENADYAWRIDYLRQLPAAVKFISFEPLLADIGNIDLVGIDWAIVGAESGRNRRLFDKQWARNLRANCRRDNVAFFYKQSSAARPGYDPFLDGRQYYEFPITRPLKYRALTSDK